MRRNKTEICTFACREGAFPRQFSAKGGERQTGGRTIWTSSFPCSKNVLEEGFIYGIVAMGVYITYKILDFPDLSVDGTFPLGCAVTAAMIVAGVNPWLACIASFCGRRTGWLRYGAAPCAAARCRSAFGHYCDDGLLVRESDYFGANQPNPLAGNSLLQFYNQPTIFTSFPMTLLPDALYRCRVLILAAVLAIVVKVLMDAFFAHQGRYAAAGGGDNPQFVTSLGRDQGNMKILGLAIGNGCTALAGSILAQQAKAPRCPSAPVWVVQALASVIIGASVLDASAVSSPLRRCCWAPSSTRRCC